MSIHGDDFILRQVKILETAPFESRDGRKIVSRVGEIAEVIYRVGFGPGDGRRVELDRDGVKYHPKRPFKAEMITLKEMEDQ